jgi:lysozyme family protein
MKRNFDAALKLVLTHEGGWADHPADPGGATMKGVTLENFRRYVKKDGTKADLRKITNAQIAEVYRRYYWDAVRGDDLPDGVDYAVFDFGVNSGPSRAVRYLQTVVGVTPDGEFGPLTMEAVGRKSAGAIIDQLCANRMTFLQGLNTWKTFGKGWKRRVDDVRVQARKMAAAKPVEPAKPVPAPSPAPVPQSPPAAKPGHKRSVLTFVAAAVVATAAYLVNLPCEWLGLFCGN